MPPLSSRRDFLKTVTAGGIAAAVGDFVPRAVAAAGADGGVAPAAPSWVDKPMRWAQLTLVEDDPQPGKFDLGFWLDYFARTKSDAVCLSGGGGVRKEVHQAEGDGLRVPPRLPDRPGVLFFACGSRESVQRQWLKTRKLRKR